MRLLVFWNFRVPQNSSDEAGLMRCFFGRCWSRQAENRKRFVFLCLMTLRLILRRCLTGTYYVQNNGEAPFGHPKSRPHHSLPIRAPGPFTAADAKIAQFWMDTLAIPQQAEGIPFCCLCFLRLSPTGLAKACHGWLDLCVPAGYLRYRSRISRYKNILIWIWQWLPLSKPGRRERRIL